MTARLTKNQINQEPQTTNQEPRTAKPTLGIVAISKNEEADLPAFLDHLLTWVDEIVVVDDGSTDGTLELLRAAGPKVKVVEQVRDSALGGFARQRNRGIEEATADWLLHMDIDERVPPELADEIRETIADTKYNGFRYRRLNFFLNRPMKGGGLQAWNNPQLARGGKHRFHHSVHETCDTEGGPSMVGQLQHPMWHLNDDSYRERLDKSMEYCEGVADRLEERGIRIRWFHLLFLPMAEFARKWIRYAGWRDGMAGWLWALHCADSMFRSCALLWDRQNRVQREGIEKELREKWAEGRARRSEGGSRRSEG